MPYIRHGAIPANANTVSMPKDRIKKASVRRMHGTLIRKWHKLYPGDRVAPPPAIAQAPNAAWVMTIGETRDSMT